MKIIPVPRRQGVPLAQALDMIQQGYICLPNVAIQSSAGSPGGSIAIPGQPASIAPPVSAVDLWIGGQIAQIPVPMLAQLLYETSQETFGGPAEMLESVVKVVFRMSLLEFIEKVEGMNAGTEGDNPIAEEKGG